jgi:hypothetical protein
MDALWRLASDYALDDRTLVQAALGLGAALLVPGHAFGARFGRVLGDRISIDAANDERLPDDRAIREGEIAVDERHATAIARQLTAHWNDASGAQLIAPFTAANALYVLSFWSPQPSPRAFTLDDVGFAESIATLIGSRIQHKWDAVARDPLEVVSLSGAAG